jgi:Ca2+-transporting ATPase
MTHVWRVSGSDAQVVAIKGAPEAVLGLCRLDAEQLARVRAAVQRLAQRGIRVLGVARGRWSGRTWPSGPGGFDPEFLGLVGLVDPLREAVPGAVRECREAGIQVAMMTGDYPVTALAIADQAGIDTGAGVLDGDTLRRLSDADLREQLARVRVFARVTPDQKLRLIRALRDRGEVVAMTGDGVNDAPSLKAAQIGIAMGGRGTDVAREAAAIVLLDDQFGAIVAAVRLGRRIHDNLRKAMAFVLAVHVPIAGLALLPVLFGLPVMLSPVHIAFLELVIDPVCSIVFEAEPDERDVMARPPRAPAAALFTTRALAASLLQGLLVLAAVATLMLALLAGGAAEPAVRASGFIALLLGNIGLVLRNRSFGASCWQALARRNPALWWVIGATSALMGVVFALEPLRTLFRFDLPDAIQLGWAALTGLTVAMALFMLPIRVR